MENHLYTCEYCGGSYKPKRRGIQKYCSTSCRVRAFVIKKGTGLGPLKPEDKKPELVKIDQISGAGIVNAAAGTLIADVIEYGINKILTKEEDRPATKKDLNQLKETLRKRFYPIKNMPQSIDGKYPFYDFETQTYVYRKSPLSW